MLGWVLTASAPAPAPCACVLQAWLSVLKVWGPIQSIKQRYGECDLHLLPSWAIDRRVVGERPTSYESHHRLRLRLRSIKVLCVNSVD